MAGGMRRGGLGSMASRLAQSRPQASEPPPVPPPPLKHCWVHGTQGRLPGLLLGWEQRADGWHGRVVHPEPDVDGWAVVEEWMPAHVLEPVVEAGGPGGR